GGQVGAGAAGHVEQAVAGAAPVRFDQIMDARGHPRPVVGVAAVDRVVEDGRAAVRLLDALPTQTGAPEPGWCSLMQRSMPRRPIIRCWKAPNWAPAAAAATTSGRSSG